MAKFTTPEPADRLPDVRPTYWQVPPCPKCGRRFWATPWEPHTTCCNQYLTGVAVYLPFNPAGSAFGR